QRYVQFGRANADSIWNQDQGPDHQFGQVWSGPFQLDNSAAATQTSALDAIVAAAEMWTPPQSSSKAGDQHKSLPSPIGRRPQPSVYFLELLEDHIPPKCSAPNHRQLGRSADALAALSDFIAGFNQRLALVVGD